MVTGSTLHSSLKTPGSQTQSKSVRFADCVGESLEMVRYVHEVRSADSQLQTPSTSADSDVRVGLELMFFNLSESLFFVTTSQL
uniref:Uncharacterized protein n=1 Tax=Syphacia muris TaxID=451379 RepID=A0A0N5AML8_9BILA